jgi:DNA-binding SARP family transcriptional activator
MWGEHYIDIPRRRARALLFRLAVDMLPVAREHLVYLFWSNIPDSTAHRDLTHLLTHLRAALPDELQIQTTSDFVFLNPSSVWSDSSAFLELFRAPFARASMEILTQATELFRGPLLDGFSLDHCPEFEEWLTMERSVWERRNLSLIATIERESLKYNDLGLAILSAQHCQALDGVDSEMHRRLGHAYLTEGESDLGHRQWQAMRDLVGEEPPA